MDWPNMVTIVRLAVAFSVACGWTASAAAQTPAPAGLDRYNVVWTTPSKNAAGSMPIGNGEVGLNVWVEENGDLLFYIARTDAWSECNRLLKLGRIRVSLSPNPFAKGKPFRQELKLRDGQIVITAGDATLRVFVDANAPVIYVTGESTNARGPSRPSSKAGVRKGTCSRAKNSSRVGRCRKRPLRSRFGKVADVVVAYRCRMPCNGIIATPIPSCR